MSEAGRARRGIDGAAMGSIIAVALRTNLRRLTVWIFAAAFLWIVYQLYWGGLRFGGMTATGEKLATNSDYAVAAVLGVFSFFLMHFTATLTGDPVVKDARLGVAPLLRATPLDRGSYLIGKFLGGYVSLLAIYALFLVSLLLGQILPPDEDKLTLPFRILPYAKFAFLYMLVPTFFVGALSFMIGTLSGSMKMVYIAVTALFVGWLLTLQLVEDEHYRWLAYVEPSGTLWLSENVARSRGNAWLNQNPIIPDLGFALNRLALLAGGGLALVVTLVRWRPELAGSEYGGEVRESLPVRIFRWISGRQRAIADRYTNWVGSGSIPLVEPAPRGIGLWLEHVRSSSVTELRLLAAERSLWIMVPVIAVLAVFTTGAAAGPFNLPIYPVSSEVAARMVGVLLILIAGTSIFYTGEVFHRDEAEGVRSILYATPVANSALLLAKLLAMVILACGVVLVTYATAVGTQMFKWWLLDGSFYFEPGPYVELGLRMMLPALVIICTTSLVVNVLLRRRYLAYFALIFLGGWYLWSFIDGQRSVLWNPLLLGHLRYSDMTRLEPFERVLQLHHRYWGSMVVFLLCAASWFLARSGGTKWNLRHHFTRHYVRRHTGLLTLGLAALASTLWFGTSIHAAGALRGTRAEIEAAQLRMEDAWLDQLWAPTLAYHSVDIEVDLWPDQKALDVRGTLRLANDHTEDIDRAVFSVDPLYEIRRFEIDRQVGAYRLEDSVLVVDLSPPVAPGETVDLLLDWSGVVNPGIARNGGAQSTFIHRSGTFLNSFTPAVIPVPGITGEMFLADEERRREHDRDELTLLEDRSGDPFVPGIFGGTVPYDLRARITAPAGQTVLCGGELVEHARAGEREVHVFESRHPLYTFAILAAEYHVRRSGDDEVWYHPEHTYNLETVLEALRDGRDYFGRRFGRYPHRLLRIVEFPRLASFAQSYPTLMPYSEAIGFLTNYRDEDRFVDATYFVTAHEVAHQWWAYIESPGASLGAQVLSESLAEYSAMVLIDERRGERSRLIFLQREEDAYLRRRDPDEELPLVELEFEGAPVWYNKGCLVFHMLERRIGRHALHERLAAFVEQWRHDPDDPQLAPGDPAHRLRALSHPTVEDLIDALRPPPRERSMDGFYDTWFRQVIVPDPALVGEPILREEHGGWSVEFEAENLSGRPDHPLPVQVELVAGNWKADEPGSMVRGTWNVSPPLELQLEPGQRVRGTLSCSFRPEAIVLDRLHGCIDFDRTNNVRPLSVSGAVPGTSPPAATTPAGRR